MKTLIFTITLALTLLLSLPVMAQEPASSATDELLGLVGEAVVEEATQANDDLRKAKEILDKVRNRQSTREEQEQAERDYKRAEERSSEANANLDEARIHALAEESGHSPAEIRSMRESGMGWGKIAKEVGVHPSANSKGKGKGKSKNKNKGNGKKK